MSRPFARRNEWHDPRATFGPGRYVVKPIQDDEWWGYWQAYLNEKRVNGGLCRDFTDGARCARYAIERARDTMLREMYYWDHETCTWVKKGTLPPL